MAITVAEMIESRAGDAASQELVFLVNGTDDDAAAHTALLGTGGAPATLNGLVRDDATAHLEPLSVTGAAATSSWTARVKYNKAEWLAPQTGDASFSFDTTGGTQHITQSKQTISKTAASGTAPDFGGAIGVTHDSVEGVDLTIPVFSFSLTRYIAAADMSQTYIGQLYSVTGKVNASPWTVNVDGVQLTFAGGEALFLGASGGKRRSENDWEIGFRFAASPNATNLTIGSITVPSKKGWEYLWVRYEDAEDENAQAIVKRPVAAYVEKVYDEGDFALLGIS